MIKLDKRLTVIYNTVRENTRLADIGTDHAYLVCRLLCDGKITFGYACDINKGPLENAKTTAEQNNVSNIKFVLCDGLSGVGKDEVDEIVIAGMGGELIEKILTSCEWAKSKDKHFILQPMTKADSLRKYLCENGFIIESETGVTDNSHYYTVMSVYYVGETLPYDECFLQIGKLSPNHPESREYILNKIDVLKKHANAVKGIQPDTAKKLFEVIEKMKGVCSNDN